MLILASLAFLAVPAITADVIVADRITAFPTAGLPLRAALSVDRTRC